MNTDDYIKAIEHDIHDIHKRVDKIDARLYLMEKNNVKSLLKKHGWQILAMILQIFGLITLWCDLWYTYKVWKPNG